MNSCYAMSLVTFVVLLIGFFQSFLKFHVFSAGHVTFMILVCILYLFTETLVIFFYVGTGVSIKEYVLDHKLDAVFHKRSIAIKRKVYPPLLLNMLFMMILFILVGAADTFRMPIWFYSTIYLACIFHYLKIKVVQHNCFRENTKIVLDMSGIKADL